MNPKYSDKEIKLFERLGYKDLLFSEPYQLYQIVALDAFMNDKTGEDVDSIRKCLKAFKVGKPYRLTKEFDDLI
jgi:hypothetical protein